MSPPAPTPRRPPRVRPRGQLRARAVPACCEGEGLLDPLLILDLVRLRWRQRSLNRASGLLLACALRARRARRPVHTRCWDVSTRTHQSPKSVCLEGSSVLREPPNT
jgi:hypothetical protein